MQMKCSPHLPTWITDSSVSEYFSSVCLISCRQHSRLSTPYFCCCCNNWFAHLLKAEPPRLKVKSGLRPCGLHSLFQDVQLSSSSLHRFHLLCSLHPPQSHIVHHLHLMCHWSTYNTIIWHGKITTTVKNLELRLTLSDQTGRCRSPHQEWSLLKEKVWRKAC